MEAVQHSISQSEEFFLSKGSGQKRGPREFGKGTNEQSGMHMELLRLATFHNWPRWAEMTATRLARAGFFYTGVEDTVECFSCGRRSSRWREGDVPMKKHARDSPHCELVHKGASGWSGAQHLENIPLPRPVSSRPESLPEHLWGRMDTGYVSEANITDSRETRYKQTTQEANITDSRETFYKPAAPMVGLVQGASNYPTPSASNANASPSPTPSPSPSPATATATAPQHLSPIPHPSYRTEASRLATFATWPSEAYTAPSDLAQAGFVYLGAGDRVQCAFCGGIKEGWQPLEKPFQEHQKRHPDCPFVLNPRIGAPSQRLEARGTASASGGPREDDGMAGLAALGVDTDMPKNHRMALFASRVESFKNWPKTAIQKPALLADAGFYFIERGDSVKCYWCEGGLKNWEAEDDPWVEHTRWFPKCGHLKRSKGPVFIEYIQKNGKAPPWHSNTVQIDAEVLRARMDEPLVREALNMGFDRSLVENVIHYRLATKGDFFARADELVECILEYTERPPQDFPLSRSPAPNASAPAAKSKSKKKRNKKKKSAKAGSGSGSGAATGASSAGNSSTPQAAASAPSAAAAAAATAEGSRMDEDSGNDSNEETSMETQQAAASNQGDDDDDTRRGRMECRICMERDVDVLFLPCRHLVCCQKCAPEMLTCPLCRADIQGTINVYMP